MRTIHPATPEDRAAFKLDQQPSALFVAEEDGEVIGGIGADWSDGRHVQVGPLTLLPGHEHKKWAILRLTEFVEGFLAKAGVTSYVFFVPENNVRHRRVVEHAGARPYAYENGNIWYRREVGSYGIA